ncbi:MAG: zinc-binding dehydrogenase, partial [Bryobacteraceae bacterium]
RARLAERAGARYLSRPERADVVIEATGAPDAAFAAIASLAPLGVCALLGAGAGRGEIRFLDLVVGNQVVFGSVNASPGSFARAAEDLARFDAALLRAMIRRTSRALDAILHPPPDAVKMVVEVN